MAQIMLVGLLGVLIITFSDEISKFIKNKRIPFFKKPYIWHYTLLIIFSIVFVLIDLHSLINNLLISLVKLYHIFENALAFLFAKINLVLPRTRAAIALLLLATLPWFIIVGFYWLSHKKFLPHFYRNVWISWAILVFIISMGSSIH